MSAHQSEAQTGLAPVLVGLLDSGLRPELRERAAAAADFTAPQGDGEADSPGGLAARWPVDRLGHGSCLAEVILEQAPGVQLCCARIFDRQLATSAAVAAEGLDWLVGQGVRVINLSFGLRQDRPVLARACQRALRAGVILVAAAPAAGHPVYPGFYPGVIRVTGDVRCQPGEISWRPSAQADFGACVRARHPRIIGASVATAYVTARTACFLKGQSGAAPDSALLGWLRGQARYHRTQRPFRLIPWERRLTWEGAHS